MTPEKADSFARQLNELCHRHGVMLWTALVTTPMCISDADPDDNYYYVAERGCLPDSFIIRRVLR